MNEKLLFENKSFTVNFKVYEDFCEIEYRKTFWSFVFSGKFFSGKKRIYYRDVTGIQFRPVGKIFTGYLKFEYPGAPARSHFGNLFSDSAVTFKQAYAEQMNLIYLYILNRVHELKISCTVSTVPDEPVGSTADDIMLKFQKLEEERIQREAALMAEREAEVLRKAEEMNRRITDANFIAYFTKLNKKFTKFSIIGFAAYVIPVSLISLIVSILLIFAAGAGIPLVIAVIWGFAVSLLVPILVIPTFKKSMKSPAEGMKTRNRSLIISIILTAVLVFNQILLAPYAALHILMLVKYSKVLSGTNT